MTMSPIIAPDTRIWIGGHDRRARAAVEPLLASAIRPPDGPIDRLILTPLTADEAIYFTRKNLARLEGSGEVWLVMREPAATDLRSAFAGCMHDEGFVENGFVTIGSGHAIATWRRGVTPPPANSPA